MARRSNKTAHVLNLIAAGHDTQSDSTEESVVEKKDGAAANASDPAPARPASAPSPNSISVIDTTTKDPVSDLIQQQLNNSLNEQTQPAAPTPDAVPDAASDKGTTPAPEPTVQLASNHESAEKIPLAAAPAGEAAISAPAPDKEPDILETEPQSVPESQPAPESQTASEPEIQSVPESQPVQKLQTVSEPESQSVPESHTTPESQTASEPEAQSAPNLQNTLEPQSAQNPQSAPQPQAISEPEPEPDFVRLNIMESIVADKIIYYMRQFDVCTCDRCVADTTALTLNGLLPKYIVTTPAAVDPLVSYYTNRLISDVTVEATKACMIVKENPRH